PPPSPTPTGQPAPPAPPAVKAQPQPRVAPSQPQPAPASPRAPQPRAPEPPAVASAPVRPPTPEPPAADGLQASTPPSKPAEPIVDEPVRPPEAQPREAAPATPPPPQVAAVPPSPPLVDSRSALRRGGPAGAGGAGEGWAGIEGEPIPLDSADPKYNDYLERVRRMIKEKWGYPCIKDIETGRLVVAVAGRDVLDAGIAPLLLDHPPHALEVVVVLRIAGVERNRLAFDPGPALARAAGATRSASTQRGSAVDQGWLRWDRRHPGLRRARLARRRFGSARRLVDHRLGGRRGRRRSLEPVGRGRLGRGRPGRRAHGSRLLGSAWLLGRAGFPWARPGWGRGQSGLR